MTEGGAIVAAIIRSETRGQVYGRGIFVATNGSTPPAFVCVGIPGVQLREAPDEQDLDEELDDKGI